MRFCVAVPMIYGSKADLADCIKAVSSLGYDAVEIYNWQNIDIANVKKALDETGVEMLSICTTEFRLNDPTYRDKWLTEVEKSCQIANALGAKKMITQVGQDTGESRKTQHDAIVTTLKQATPILEKYGVTIMIEPLNVLVDHKGYYLTSASEAFDIVRSVDHPLVKVIYDIYHQQISEGNILPTITANIDQIAHIHVAGHPGRHEPWLGETNYEYIFIELEKIGYDGAIGLEYKPTLQPNESLKEFLRRYKK